VFVAGYDIRTKEAYESTLSQLEKHIGKDKLKVIHANDSQKGLGSKVDRHAHIGDGEIGIEAFRCLVNDPRMSGLPIIIETPETETMAKVNLERLKGLMIN
jgi:deoxyribonuclease-4